jgi:hypothetical protein
MSAANENGHARRRGLTQAELDEIKSKYEKWAALPYGEGGTIDDFCRDVLGVSKVTFYAWKRRGFSKQNRKPVGDRARLIKLEEYVHELRVRMSALELRNDELERRLEER